MTDRGLELISKAKDFKYNPDLTISSIDYDTMDTKKECITQEYFDTLLENGMTIFKKMELVKNISNLDCMRDKEVIEHIYNLLNGRK